MQWAYWGTAALYLWVARRVLAQRPEHLGARRNLGESLLEAGEYAQALQLFAQGLRLVPGEVSFYYGMARAQEGDGQIRAALVSYRRFLQYARLDEKARASLEEHINELQRKLGRERLQ
jgi:tetratricopeptide (TPR) repeat protein